MSDYTPTTDEIVAGKVHLGDNYWRELTEDDIRRWLDEHDRQVAERAWDEGWDASERYGYPVDGPEDYKNPYRAAKGEQK